MVSLEAKSNNAQYKYHTTASLLSWISPTTTSCSTMSPPRRLPRTSSRSYFGINNTWNTHSTTWRRGFITSKDSRASQAVETEIGTPVLLAHDTPGFPTRLQKNAGWKPSFFTFFLNFHYLLDAGCSAWVVRSLREGRTYREGGLRRPARSMWTSAQRLTMRRSWQ